MQACRQPSTGCHDCIVTGAKGKHSSVCACGGPVAAGVGHVLGLLQDPGIGEGKPEGGAAALLCLSIRWDHQLDPGQFDGRVLHCSQILHYLADSVLLCICMAGMQCHVVMPCWWSQAWLQMGKVCHMQFAQPNRLGQVLQ